VVLPKRNAADLDDVPAEVRESLTFHFAETLDDVLRVALLDNPTSAQWPMPQLNLDRAPGSKPLTSVDGYA
jgi:ATP-dependent Lon protease